MHIVIITVSWCHALTSDTRVLLIKCPCAKYSFFVLDQNLSVTTLCWIDVYQGPPDCIVHDAGTQLASAEFKQEAKILGSRTKEVPIEAHQSVGKVERYHLTLRRAYEVIKGDLPNTNREAILQMAVKAINDTAGPNGIVPTLLVFGAFPRLTEESSPSPSIIRRAGAIHNATKEVKRLYAQ